MALKASSWSQEVTLGGFSAFWARFERFVSQLAVLLLMQGTTALLVHCSPFLYCKKEICGDIPALLCEEVAVVHSVVSLQLDLAVK